MSLCMLSLIWFKVCCKWVDVFVCFMMSCFNNINLCFIELIELCKRFVRVIVFWWFFFIVFIILLNLVLIVDIKEERCFFWMVMVWVIWVLFLFRVCMCCCNVVILLEVVVLKRDFEICFIKLKMLCLDLDLDELMKDLGFGRWFCGISMWILCMVVFRFVMVWVRSVLSVLIICLLYL